MFWEMHLQNSSLKPFRDILDQLCLTTTAHQIKQLHNGRGRQNWPVEGMLCSLYAMSILQLRSTELFRRELQRNPPLMSALGFKLKACQGSEDGDPHRLYLVPSATAFSRNRKLLCQLEAQTGVVKAEFLRQNEKFSERLSDYGEEIGYDGKTIESHSTGQKLPHKREPKSGERLSSDPDASWGCHSQYGTDANGKEKVTKKFCAIRRMFWQT